jgi:hypothetical protein
MLGDVPPAYKHLSLHYPIVAGNIPMIELLLNNGADVNVSYVHSDAAHSTVTHQITPLLTAIKWCSGDQSKVIQLLLDRGAHLSDSLSHALYYSHDLTKKHGIIQLLLEHGANPFLVAGDGRETVFESAMLDLQEGNMDLEILRLFFESQFSYLRIGPDLPPVMLFVYNLTTLLQPQHYDRAISISTSSPGIGNDDAYFREDHVYTDINSHSQSVMFNSFRRKGGDLPLNLAHELQEHLKTNTQPCTEPGKAAFLLRCATYSHDAETIQFVVDAIGASNLGRYNSICSPFFEIEEQFDATLKYRESRELIVQASRKRDYELVASLLHAGIPAFCTWSVGTPDTALTAAIRNEDLVMVCLCLSYNRRQVSEASRETVLDFIFRGNYWKGNRKNGIISMVQEIGLSETLSWAINSAFAQENSSQYAYIPYSPRSYSGSTYLDTLTMGHHAIRILTKTPAKWLDTHFSDPQCYALCKQAFDKDLARFEINKIITKWGYQPFVEP